MQSIIGSEGSFSDNSGNAPRTGISPSSLLIKDPSSHGWLSGKICEEHQMKIPIPGFSLFFEIFLFLGLDLMNDN
jgi:hypothetical protein